MPEKTSEFLALIAEHPELYYDEELFLAALHKASMPFNKVHLQTVKEDASLEEIIGAFFYGVCQKKFLEAYIDVFTTFFTS